MKFVIQRVSKASVTVDNQMIGSIGKGFLVLIGVCDSDTKETADKMIVCRLPQRKPAVFYKSGRAAVGK